MKTNLYWNTDFRIPARELRVIGSDGKQLGILSKEAAIDAAKKEGLTLVEIAPNAKPPVAKIVDFGKFRYQEEKKLKKGSKVKGGDLKEIRFSPFIAENDYATRLNRVREFLAEKNKVRPVVVFKGPQLRSRQFGYDLLKRIVTELGDSIVVDMEPKFLGKHLMMVISPTNKKPVKLENKETVGEEASVQNENEQTEI